MTTPLLQSADIRLIHLVASRRRGVPAPALDEAALDSTMANLTGGDSGTPFARTAGVAAAVIGLVDDPAVAGQMALLALCCQLAVEGFTLVAPQGVLAGMVADLRSGRGNEASLSRWLEDRALPVGIG